MKAKVQVIGNTGDNVDKSYITVYVSKTSLPLERRSNPLLFFTMSSFALFSWII